MTYTVIEMQTNGSTTAIVPPQVYQRREDAESRWHTIMAAAAVSQVEIHTAVILNQDGNMEKSGSYYHPQTP